MSMDFRLSVDHAPDVAITGAALNSLAYGAFVWGPEIDNSTDLYPYGKVSLALNSVITAGYPAQLTWYLVEPDFAGNYPASAGDPGMSQLVATWDMPGGSGSFAYTGSILIGRILAPKFKLAMANKLIATLPGNNLSVCQLRRFGDSGS